MQDRPPAVPAHGHFVIDESEIDALEDFDEFSCWIWVGNFTSRMLVYATSSEIEEALGWDEAATIGSTGVESEYDR